MFSVSLSNVEYPSLIADEIGVHSSPRKKDGSDSVQLSRCFDTLLAELLAVFRGTSQSERTSGNESNDLAIGFLFPYSGTKQGKYEVISDREAASILA